MEQRLPPERYFHEISRSGLLTEVCVHIPSLVRIGQNDRHFTLMSKYVYGILTCFVFILETLCVFSVRYELGLKKRLRMNYGRL
jgi:hypothetical protein